MRRRAPAAPCRPPTWTAPRPLWRRPTWPAAMASASSRSAPTGCGPTPRTRPTTNSWAAPITPTASRWRRPTARRRPRRQHGCADRDQCGAEHRRHLVGHRRGQLRGLCGAGQRGRQQWLRQVLDRHRRGVDLHQEQGPQRIRGRHRLHRQHHGGDGRRHDAGPGASTAALTETNAAQSTGGTLSATDVDSSAAFVAQANVAGSNGFGKFSIGTDGVWTYTKNKAHNEFVGGTDYTDSITVATADGTTQAPAPARLR